MIDYDSLIALLSLTRRIGKTTLAIELAKKSGSILVCPSYKEATNARNEGIEAVSIYAIDRLRGLDRSIVLDQDAIIEILIAHTRPTSIDFLRAVDDLIRASPAIALTSQNNELRDRALSILNDNT